MATLEHYVRLRHSTRYFKNSPVPLDTLRECLSLAQLAPSNSNIQNWRIAIASGQARDKIAAALLCEAAKHDPAIRPLPEQFKPFRSEFGHFLYGEKGYNIAADDREGAKKMSLRNFEFFGAPCCAVISMDRDLGDSPVDAMSVGMFIQIFMLALAERGLGSCLQVSVAGYPEVLREGFKLEDNQLVLCGMTIGWPLENNSVNKLEVPRDDIAKQVKFLEE
ncbi:hypothetical protein Q7P37_006023 [Cladosporium fusiforme]